MMDLSKLILLLGSDNDGEALNAARAIGRKLKADGKDWHWLSSKLSGPPDYLKQKTPAQPQQKKQQRDFTTGENYYNRMAYVMVDYLMQRLDELYNDRQREFVQSMKDDYIDTGRTMSEAQIQYLRGIYDKTKRPQGKRSWR